MARSRRTRIAALSVAVVGVAAVVIVLIASSTGNQHRPARIALPAGAEQLTIGSPIPAPKIQPGFLGLSFEYSSIEQYAGTDPRAIDPVFEQLIRNIVPVQAPVIRIGGDTTDHTWWPVDGMQPPGGVKYTLDPGWLAVTRALTRALGARLILGINLEADSGPLAAAEARALVTGLGARSIEALEPGNEPELYGIFTWYRTPAGVDVKGRPPGYDVASFTRDFTSLSRALPPVALAGPTIGAPKWYSQLGTILAAEPRIRLVTLHRYPTQYCFARPGHLNYPTIGHLLSAYTSRGLAASVARYVALARARGLALRIDEMNTISCGYDPSVGYSFASALWAVDTLFAMADVGVDGVNIHGFPGSTCSLFQITRAGGRWQAFVEPEYYGLQLFAQAAPPGSRLLRVSGAAPGDLRAWGTRAPGGRVRVVLIDDSPSHAFTVAVADGTAAGRPATLERLLAPSLRSGHGVTLAGRGFGARTLTGLPDGPRRVTAVRALGGRDYVVRVPAGSAALITLPDGRA